MRHLRYMCQRLPDLECRAPRSGSWARLHHDPTAKGAHTLPIPGREQESPGAGRWRFTVTPETQRIVLLDD